jgi:hypothetical protein
MFDYTFAIKILYAVKKRKKRFDFGDDSITNVGVFVSKTGGALRNCFRPLS